MGRTATPSRPEEGKCHTSNTSKNNRHTPTNKQLPNNNDVYPLNFATLDGFRINRKPTTNKIIVGIDQKIPNPKFIVFLLTYVPK
jgi:hypothetical protein